MSDIRHWTSFVTHALMQTDYQQTFIEWRAKIVLEVGNQIMFVVVVIVIYLIGNFFVVLVT